MSDLFIPFNHQPVSTSRGTGTFTCGAGKYARVRVQISGTAYASNIATNGSSTFGGGGSSDSFNYSFEIWVKSGDTVAFSAASAASASTGAVAAGTVTDSTYIEVHYNGNVIAVGECAAFAYHNLSAGTGSSSVSGNLNYIWYAEEYNELT